MRGYCAWDPLGRPDTAGDYDLNGFGGIICGMDGYGVYWWRAGIAMVVEALYN